MHSYCTSKDQIVDSSEALHCCFYFLFFCFFYFLMDYTGHIYCQIWQVTKIIFVSLLGIFPHERLETNSLQIVQFQSTLQWTCTVCDSWNQELFLIDQEHQYQLCAWVVGCTVSMDFKCGALNMQLYSTVRQRSLDIWHLSNS